jgi:hypothetical protein
MKALLPCTGGAITGLLTWAVPKKVWHWVKLVTLFFFFWWYRGLSSGLHIYKASILPLKPQLQSILLWLFSRWGSCKLFAWAGLELWFSWSEPPEKLGKRNEPPLPS